MVEAARMKLWLVMHDAYEDVLCFAQDAETAAKIWHGYYDVKPAAHRTVKCVELPGLHPEVKVSRAMHLDDLHFSEVIGTQLLNYTIN